MEKVILNADIRENTGKEPNKKLRNKGLVPAVVYKKGKEASSLKVDASELFHTLHTSAGENVIVTLKVKGEKKESKPEKDKTVIIKEIQYDPIKGDVLHLDFYEISLTDKITVTIPIETKGEPEGVRVEEGVMDQPTKELQIECLPTAIPEKIDIHVEHLKINDSIKVKDLDVPPDVKVLNDPEQTVVSVMPPRVEEEVPAEEAGEEAAEPEVIKEKKPEAEEGAEAAPAAEPKKEEEKQ